MLLFALLVTAGAACTDDGEDAASEDRPTTTTSSSTTVATLPEEEYLDRSDELAGEVDASGDFCGLMDVLGELISGAVGNPTTTEQVRSIVETTTGLFDSISASGTVDATTSETLAEMSEVLGEEAAAAGYSLEFIQLQGDAAPLSEPRYVAVMEALVARAQTECPGFGEGLGG